MHITQDANLIIQSYYSTVLLVELNKNHFLESEYFNSLPFDDPGIKVTLKQIGIDNQGFLINLLYSILVVPKQLIGDRYKEDYANINQQVRRLAKNVNSTYKKDSSNIDYIRHIRNAVAHARVEFSPTHKVTFKDSNNNSENFIADIELRNLPEIIDALMRVHVKYITDVISGK